MDGIKRLIGRGWLAPSIFLLTTIITFTGCGDQLNDKKVPGLEGANSSRKPVIQSFTLDPEVTSPNRAVLAKVTATDPDTDELTYIFSAEGSISATSSQNAVYWTPPATPGKYNISATVTDKVNIVFAQKEVTVTANTNEPPVEPPVNQAPVVTALVFSETAVEAGKPVMVTTGASDPDGDPLTYTFSGEGSIVHTALPHIVNWTPPSQAGTYSLTVTVTDGSHTESRSGQVTVTEHVDPPAIDENTILFEDFETDSTVTWIPFWALESTLVSASFPDAGINASRCLSVTSQSDQYWSYAHTQTLKVNPGESYGFEGYLSSDGDSIEARISFETYDSNLAKLDHHFAEQKVTNHTQQWTKVANTFTIPGNVHHIRLRLTGAGIGTSRFDAIHFYKIPGEPEEPSLEPVRAFPGAQGYGADSIGGRGGRVIEVTNLNDSGTGSLRAALEASGARIVVFRVGGTINLAKAIDVKNPYVTIAGQTAPGDGICLRGAGIAVRTHNVIIRGLRIRAGDASTGPPKDQRDNLQILGSSSSRVDNVIVDHCSFSWGTDENVSMGYGVSDITVQWSIVSEGLYNAGHPEGNHSAGLLVAEQSDRVSIHHNLMAHNDWRNPLFKGDATGEVIGNVVYNWGWEGCRFTDDKNTYPVFADVRGNYYQKGPAVKKTYGVDISSSIDSGSRIFLEGNIGPTRLSDSLDNWLITNGDTRFKASSPFSSPTDVTLRSALENRQLVLDHAGAISPFRDAVDRRIVDGVINNRGNIINSPSDVGGWPTLRNGTPPTDADHDGMPDEWERAHGLDPSNAADRNTTAPSGYTWVEEYLNSLITLPY